MCAPLVAGRLGARAVPKRSGIWLYNLGRGCAYVTAGAFLGALASGLGTLSASIAVALSLALGATLISAGVLALVRGRSVQLKLISSSSKAGRLIGRNLAKLRRWPLGLQDFMLGLVTVGLPCMTLTPALAAAMGSGSAASGAVLMSAFFAGTLPVMLLAPAVPNLLQTHVNPRFANVFSALFLIAAGIITVLRVWH